MPLSRLTCKNLSKKYKSVTAVCNASLQFASGATTVIMGPNGAGKSTLLNLLSGVERPDAGSILVGGVDVTSWPPHRRVEAGLVRSFQDGRVARLLSIRENVRAASSRGETVLGALLSREPTALESQSLFRSHALLRDLGLAQGFDELAGTLSHGSQRMLSMVMCIAAAPKFLLLDEPFAGLSYEAIGRLSAILRELTRVGTSLVVIEHNLEACRLIAEQVVVMVSGRVVAESDAGLLERPEQIMALYEGS